MYASVLRSGGGGAAAAALITGIHQRKKKITTTKSQSAVIRCEENFKTTSENNNNNNNNENDNDNDNPLVWPYTAEASSKYLKKENNNEDYSAPGGWTRHPNGRTHYTTLYYILYMYINSVAQ